MRAHSAHWTALAALLLAAPSALATPVCKQTYGEGQQTVRLATGSPGELGLVKALADAFNAGHDTQICWVKAGSGKSLKLLKAGDVDLVLVHAPKAEKQAVIDGWASERTLIGANEFYLVGPSADPAGIRNADSVAGAYRLIADEQAGFVTRNDNSGTHKKELSIWQMAERQPGGDWYHASNTFMLASLKQADAQADYFMTDSSTYQVGESELSDTQVLFKGDPYLINTYHGLLPAKPLTEAQALLRFIASDDGQALFAHYGTDEYGAPR